MAPITVGPVSIIVRALGPGPTVDLAPGERVLEEISVNHFLGGEARGGKLLLTDRRVALRPNWFDVQFETWAVPRSEVSTTRTERLRVLIARTRDGTEHWFVAMHPLDVAVRLEASA